MASSSRDVVGGAPGGGCPTPEELLCAADGALPRLRQLQVAAHLLRCPSCRAHVRDVAAIESVVNEEDAAAFSTEADGPAPSYAAFLERLQAQEREMAQAERHPVRRWVAAAAVLSVVVAGALLTRSHGIVAHADELLERIAAEEASSAAGTVQRVRYHLGPVGIGKPNISDGFAVVREVHHGVTVDQAAAESAAPPPDLQRALTVYGFDWRRPLSVASVRRWRAGLPRRRDDVTTTRDGLVLLRTVSGDGRLRVVELFVRPDTHHVVRQALVFDGLGRLEIEELAVWRADQEAATAVALTGEASVVSPADLELAELDARLILQRTGVDLDGDIRVSRSRDGVRVEGRVSSAASRQAALSALAGNSQVHAALRLDARSTLPAATEPGVGLSRWLDVAYGERQGRERFVVDLLRLTDRVKRHVTVLQELATRYPESEGKQLSLAARSKLRTLAERRYVELREDMFALRAQLAAPFGTSPKRPSLPRVPPDWRQRSTAGAAQAADLEQLVKDVVFRAQDLKGRSPINRAFDLLWTTMVGS